MSIAITLPETSVAQQLADLADQYGVTPKQLASDSHADVRALVGMPNFTPHDVDRATRLFEEAIQRTMDRAAKLNTGRTVQVTLDDEPTPPPAKTEDKPRKQTRAKLFGFSVTSVIRWMGKHGWDFEKAYVAITNLAGCYELADVTYRLQLAAGAKGERGEPAPLTASQVKQLKDAAK